MTSGYVVLLCLIAAAVGTGATLSADTLIRPLAPGDTMPRLKGEFLTGREAVLPDGHAARWRCSGAGSATTLVFRSTWMTRFRELYPPGDHLTFFEVPMLGAGARLGRWFIDSGMRRGPQHNVHENVITATAARATGRRGCVSYTTSWPTWYFWIPKAASAGSTQGCWMRRARGAPGRDRSAAGGGSAIACTWRRLTHATP